MHREPARLKHVALEEKSGKREGIAQLIRRRLILEFAAQERRQPQHAIPPWLARTARYRTAGFRRDVNQLGGRARRGALIEVEPEAKLGKHLQFEARDQRGRKRTIGEVIE